MIRAWTVQRCTICIVRSRLWAGYERRAELRRNCAEIERSRDASTIHNSPCRDDRQIELSDQQSSQCDGTQRLIWGGGIEDASMAARFYTLRDDCIDAGGLDCASFVEVGRGRHQVDAPRTQCRQRFSRGQSEVKTDDRRRQLNDAINSI